MEDARKYVESLRQDMEKFDLEDQKKGKRGEDDEKVAKPLPPPKKPIRKEKLAYVPPRQLPYGKRKTMNEILGGKGTDLDAIGRQSRTCRELAERYVFYKVLPKYFRDKGYKVFVEIENEPCFYIRKSSASASMLSVVWENASTEDNPDGEACKAWDVAVYDYSGTKEPLICISIKGSMDSGTPVDLTADEWALAQNKKTGKNQFKNLLIVQISCFSLWKIFPTATTYGTFLWKTFKS